MYLLRDDFLVNRISLSSGCRCLGLGCLEKGQHSAARGTRWF